MSDIPSLPLFVDDYEAATAHLTLEEDGVYMRLLRLCWRTPGCSVPDDPAWIARRMRVSIETFDSIIEPIIDEFFTRENGRVFQRRLCAEHAYVSETIAARKEAGRRGGKAKALKNKETASSKATDLPLAKRKQTSSTHTHTHTHTHKKENPPNGGQKKAQNRGSRIAPDWQLPDDFRQWSRDFGMPDAMIEIEADIFRDYWISKPGQGGVKLDWLATWRNWCRKAVERKPKPNGGGHGHQSPRQRQLRVVANVAREIDRREEAEQGLDFGED